MRAGFVVGLHSDRLLIQPSPEHVGGHGYDQYMTAKQAIIVIHGIGEQIPMETLRGFVRGLGFTEYYNRPDNVSGNSELRRIALPARVRERPPTELFELYWAHHMHKKRAGGTLGWALNLLFRRGGWKGGPLAAAFYTLLLLLILLVTIIVQWVLEVSRSGVFTQGLTIGALVVVIIIAAIWFYISRTIDDLVADAARYLTPRPANIEARTAIRTQGLELLRALHRSGEYERIVVVGHSLGSVIGYDILRIYWDEARKPDPDLYGEQPRVKNWAKACELPENPTQQQLDTFQAAQHELWREQRTRGVPWLVTDFVTLGSPLTHASMLISTKSTPFEVLREERELPSCPPLNDDSQRDHPGFYRSALEDSQGILRPLIVGDSGALFAPTRWTNLYFPVKHLFRGDLVGGRLAPLFGPGVRDIAVHRTSRSRWRAFLRSFFPQPHTSYWARPEIQDDDEALRLSSNGTYETSHALKHYIDFKSRKGRVTFPEPDPKVENPPGGPDKIIP